MLTKNGWLSEIMNNIEWKIHATYIRNQSYSKRKTLTKDYHRWLLSGSKNFGQKLECPHCHKMENNDMDNNHFLQCEVSEEKKEVRLKTEVEYLSRFKTSDATKNAILRGTTGFYNNNNVNETGERTPKKIQE